MNTRYLLAGGCTMSAVALVVLVTGCAEPPVATSWRVAPNYSVSHTGSVSADGYLALARQYEGDQRWREARGIWRKAAEAAPQNAEIMNGLGMAEAGQGLYGNAVEALRRAVALAPQSAPMRNNLGYALLLDGRTEEAKEVLRQALALAPEHRLARDNLRQIDQLAAQAASRLQSVPDLQPLTVSLADSVAPVQAVQRRVCDRVPLRIEILNGNGVEGMAAWLGGWMRGHGLVQSTVLRNARPFNTAVTVVHYRDGCLASAQAIALRLPHRVSIAPQASGALVPDVRVTLGHDSRGVTRCAPRCVSYATGPSVAAL